MPSKLSVHIRDYPNNIWDVISRMQPRVVKVFQHDSEMNIDTLKRVAKPLVVFRKFTNLNNFQDHSADSFVAELETSGTLGKLAGRGILWEGINEPADIGPDGAQADRERAKALNRWYLRFAELMHQRGEKVAGFSWSTGNPTDRHLRWIIPSITEAAAAVDAHAFHEYAKPRSQTPHSDWGRYRLFEQALPAHARKPVVITEAGVDDIGDAATSGWAAQMSAPEYLALLARYDQVLAADNYVLGATVYTLKDPGWPSFEIDGEVLSRLADYVAGQGGGTVLGKLWPVPDFSASSRGAEVEPSYVFTAEPARITAGAPATLRWQVVGARSVSFEGQEVAAHGTRTVTPARTTGYRLHIELHDESFKDLDVVVAVDAAARTAGMTPSRPATVTLTAANLDRLRRYPRPPQDNGIGLHFHLNLGDELIEQTVEHLQSIRARWTLIYAQDELQTERAATACFRAGIMPVVRVGSRIDEAFDPVTYVDALRKALKASEFPVLNDNAPLYVQIYNEPQAEQEWRGGGRPSDWVHIFGRNWAIQAARVFDAGGYPGIQAWDRPVFDAAVDAVAVLGNQKIWQRAFFVQHNYGGNHPPAYPYDERNQQDNPGQTIVQDDFAALKFLAHAVWMQERLGFVLPIIGGEGGWLPGAEEDRRYPRIGWTLHAQYHREMFEWFRTRVLSNGEPLPDYLFSITPWIAGSWTFGGQNWWGNFLSPDGKLIETIEAVQAIPDFVRRFGWDAQPEP